MGVCGIAEVGVSVKDVPDNSGVGGISTVCGLGVTLMSVGLNTSIGLEMERRCVKSGRVCVGLGDSACGRSFTISRSLSESEKALAIFQTNGIQAGDKIGLFPRTARLNHGCSSAFNAIYSWREKEGVLVVHALKSIKAQEVRFFLLFFQSSCFQNVDGKH